jgi:hypothetical protein
MSSITLVQIEYTSLRVLLWLWSVVYKEVSLFHLKMPRSRKFCEQTMVFKHLAAFLMIFLYSSEDQKGLRVLLCRPL